MPTTDAADTMMTAKAAVAPTRTLMPRTPRLRKTSQTVTTNPSTPESSPIAIAKYPASPSLAEICSGPAANKLARAAPRKANTPKPTSPAAAATRIAENLSLCAGSTMGKDNE
jgi:hypothetical protein